VVKKWIDVFATYRTGLLTRDGYLDVSRLPAVTSDFCYRFKQWLDTHFDTWRDKSFDDRPEGFDRVDHNAQGRLLATEIKRMVGDSLEVDYLSISAEWEAKRVRNVDWEKNIPAG
jgi:hypothetical protein